MKRYLLSVLASACLFAGIAPAVTSDDGDDPGPAIITNLVVVAGLTEKEEAVLVKKLEANDKKANAIIQKNPKAFEKAATLKLGKDGPVKPRRIEMRTILLKTTDEKMPALLKSLDKYEPIGFVLPITAQFLDGVRKKNIVVGDSVISLPKNLLPSKIDKSIKVLDRDKPKWIQSLRTIRAGGDLGKGGGVGPSTSVVAFASDPMATYVDPGHGFSGITPGMPLAQTTTTTTTEETDENGDVTVTTTTTTEEDNSENTFGTSLCISWAEISEGLSEVWAAVTNEDGSADDPGSYCGEIAGELLDVGMNAFDSNGSNDNYCGS